MRISFSIAPVVMPGTVMVCLSGLAAVALLSGCSPRDNGRAEVSGSVLVDKKPLPEGAITFFPVDGTTGPSAGGIILNGEYHLASAQGAVVGRNRVEIRGFRNSEKTIRDVWDPEKILPERISVLSAEYNDRSTLKVDVRQGSNRLDFDLPGTQGH